MPSDLKGGAPKRVSPLTGRRVRYVQCGKPACENPAPWSSTKDGRWTPNCGKHTAAYVKIAGHMTRSKRVIADAAIIVGWGKVPGVKCLTPLTNCTAPGCAQTFRWKSEWGARWKRNRKCAACVEKYGRMRPFEGLYKQVVTSAKQARHKCNLTYEEFAELCLSEVCHYCGCNIVRRAIRKRKKDAGKNKAIRSVAYFLDRKDDRFPYQADNVVVCCTPCNFTKSSWLSYAEMKAIGAMRKADANGEHVTLIKKRTHLRLSRWGGRKQNGDGQEG